MARVRRFMKIEVGSAKKHPTEVDCGYAVFSSDGDRYLQISSYGSKDRDQPGTVSQTLQLNRSMAFELKALIDEAFSI
jgi:hypothetical protein